MQMERAVDGFFAISGCLIVASWDRTSSAREYFMRRAKRILPGYLLALVFTLLVGSILTQLPIGAFWKHPTTWKYIGCNLLFLNFLSPDLPGVFASNPSTSAMNPALWTIKVEVAFYLFVPVLVWLVRRLGRSAALTSMFAISAIYRIAFEHLGRDGLAKQLPGQLVFFIMGAAVYYFFPEFVAHRRKIWLVAIVLFVASEMKDWFLLDAVGTPLFVLCLAFLLPPYRGITRYGDFSYGTYVLHCPLVQMLVALGVFAWSPWGAVGIVIVSVWALGVFSWFAVERRFLRPGRVRQQETEAAAQVA